MASGDGRRIDFPLTTEQEKRMGCPRWLTARQVLQLARARIADPTSYCAEHEAENERGPTHPRGQGRFRPVRWSAAGAVLEEAGAEVAVRQEVANEVIALYGAAVEHLGPVSHAEALATLDRAIARAT